MRQSLAHHCTLADTKSFKVPKYQRFLGDTCDKGETQSFFRKIVKFSNFQKFFFSKLLKHST